MGVQSQRRKSNTKQDSNKPRHQVAYRSSGQRTISGTRAFEQLIDCIICRARHRNSHKVLHRPHHRQCPEFRPSKKLRREKEDIFKKYFKANNKPLSAEEKMRAHNMTKENVAAFFSPRSATSVSVGSPEGGGGNGGFILLVFWFQFHISFANPIFLDYVL